MNPYPSNKKGMTMIEILIVLGIVSILFTTFFYIWNTMDIFRKSRDSKRINDLQAIDTALKTILATEGNVNLGQENVIYTSLPDSSSTCGSYNLVPVFSPFSYHCQPLADYLKVDGNGWVPVNFTLGKILTIAVLPTDPLNNKDFFYAYQVKQGRYKLTARFESKTNVLKMANDGGFEPTLYEVGSNLFIPSPHSGLIGYWSFDEATGTIAYDRSGYGNNGTLYSSTTICSNPPTSGCPQWTTGKVGGALSFDGVDDYVETQNAINLAGKDFTMVAWVKRNATSGGGDHSIFLHGFGYTTCGVLHFVIRNDMPYFGLYGCDFGTSYDMSNLDLYYHLVFVNNNSPTITDKIYVNGIKIGEAIKGSYVGPDTVLRIGGGWFATIKGLIDEARVYNRALSDQEIEALYEATK
jgi:prepilin-type N-terminal cleavage/methylation domain-containing protein